MSKKSGVRSIYTKGVRIVRIGPPTFSGRRIEMWVAPNANLGICRLLKYLMVA